MKENNFNFGVTIYLKSRAVRQAANRYVPYYDNYQTMNKFIEHIKSIIKLQTDYSDEEIILKMQIHNNDPMSILREYMCGTTSVKKEEQSKSVNQTIYSEIRHLMDDAASNYKQKKEMEERNKIIRENLIRKRDESAKKLREKLNVVQEEDESAACETVAIAEEKE